MLWSRKLDGIWFAGLSLCAVACSSGSFRVVDESHELPTELPNDFRKKFEIQNHSGAEVKSASLTESGPPVTTKRLSKREAKREARREAMKQARLERPDFVYPNRRPGVDPIWMNERLTYRISYLGIPAGDFTLENMPLKTMNDRKVYHIKGNAVTSSLFNVFYRLNDTVESFIDYDGLFSHRFHVVLDESKQSRDSLELYDSEKAQTYYWDRLNHKTKGYREVKEFTPITPFSQDTVSALYYIRTLPLPTGAVITVPVVSEGKTFEAICTVLRREKMDAPWGEVTAIVLKPEMKFQGILKNQGDSFLWLTDDERRIPLRLEAKVKIGVVVGNLKEAELGTSPASVSSQYSGAGL